MLRIARGKTLKRDATCRPVRVYNMKIFQYTVNIPSMGWHRYGLIQDKPVILNCLYDLGLMALASSQI